MWKKIEREDSPWWNFEEDSVLEGIYLAKEENQGTRKNSTIHHFEIDGEEKQSWGSTVLDGKLKSVEKHYGFGAKIKIEFLGEKTSGNGLNPYKDFQVEVWEGNDVLKRKDLNIPIINEED